MCENSNIRVVIYYCILGATLLSFLGIQISMLAMTVSTSNAVSEINNNNNNILKLINEQINVSYFNQEILTSKLEKIILNVTELHAEVIIKELFDHMEEVKGVIGNLNQNMDGLIENEKYRNERLNSKIDETISSGKDHFNTLFYNLKSNLYRCS